MFKNWRSFGYDGIMYVECYGNERVGYCCDYVMYIVIFIDDCMKVFSLLCCYLDECCFEGNDNDDGNWKYFELRLL